jgi:hypothetical protein
MQAAHEFGSGSDAQMCAPSSLSHDNWNIVHYEPLPCLLSVSLQKNQFARLGVATVNISRNLTSVKAAEYTPPGLAAKFHATAHSHLLPD